MLTPAQVYNDANCIRIPHVHCETARMMTDQDMDFRDLNDLEIKAMLESGELIVLALDQFALAKQKMDLQTSWDKPANDFVQNTATADPLGGNAVIRTQGKFADGGAATEGGAAVVATDGSSTSKKEKKKGARHA